MKNIAVIGCGQISQREHIPNLIKMKIQPKICDSSEECLNYVSKKFHLNSCYMDYRELLGQPIDAVLVCVPNEFHSKVCTEFLKKRIKIFVEKPIGMGTSETKRIIKVEDKSTQNLIAGYMKRFDLGFQESTTFIRKFPFESVIVSSHVRKHRVKNYKKFKSKENMEAKKIRANRIQDELGKDVPRKIINGYDTLLKIGCHDINIINYLLQSKPIVLNTSIEHGGNYVYSELNYGKIRCKFEFSRKIQKKFTEKIDFISRNRRLKLIFYDPFLHRSAELILSNNPIQDKKLVKSTFFNSFQAELNYFVDNINRTTNQNTSFESLKDMSVIKDIILKYSL